MFRSLEKSIHNKKRKPRKGARNQPLFEDLSQAIDAISDANSNQKPGATAHTPQNACSSIVEENSIDAFFHLAALKRTNFEAQRLPRLVVNGNTRSGNKQSEESPAASAVRVFASNMHGAQQQQQFSETELDKILRIPRRPVWDGKMSATEFERLEETQFLEWREQMAQYEAMIAQRGGGRGGGGGIVMTPYEKNLEFWRQLWRVVERSDLLVQVLDARNPLLFYSSDLERYVAEFGGVATAQNSDSNGKRSLVLLNKSDLISEAQRAHWAKYFDERGVEALFWSAKLSSTKQQHDKVEEDGEENGEERHENKEGEDDDDEEEETDGEQEEEEEESNESSNDDDDDDKHEEEENEKIEKDEKIDQESKNEIVNDKEKSKGDESNDLESSEDEQENDSKTGEYEEREEIPDAATPQSSPAFPAPPLLNREALIAHFEAVAARCGFAQQMATLGMIGYPNVGKSSTINALLGRTKTHVSATPGHTKHLQTTPPISRFLALCDCPGLVLPACAPSKHHLVVAGVLPIAQMRGGDCVSACDIVCAQLPAHILCKFYGLTPPPPPPTQKKEEDEDATHFSGRQLLISYASQHGMFTTKGNPYLDKAARIILKDYVSGALLYCHPPPTISEKEFGAASQAFITQKKIDRYYKRKEVQEEARRRWLEKSKVSAAELEVTPEFAKFMCKKEAPPNQKPANSSASTTASAATFERPSSKKHNNRHSNMKARKKFANNPYED